ncbi:MAG TPA: efflux RND transporter periplasmic adaptor subunit [Gammaproteobacteria bacterium]|nr:efflux RND transporter periplasmic adaptor subunit [Gammaproteobacteria bacterium]
MSLHASRPLVVPEGGHWGRRAAASFILIGALLSVSACGRQENAAADARGAAAREAVMTVTATPLERVDVTRTISMNGSVYAWQDVIISSEVGGYRVAEVLVDVGARVRKGQRLVSLSTALLEAEVATKQAALKQREAELMNTESALERGRSLGERNLLSKADLDRLTSEQLASQSRLESARADLETSQLRLKFTDVVAPDDGIITSRTVTVGQIAQAGAEMLRLLRNGRIEWRGQAPETRLNDLQPGQGVSVMTADGTPFHGKIRVVSPTISANDRTALVYVDLPADERLRPGMFARGEIAIGTSPAAMVPLESVVSSDGYSYVFVLSEDNTVARRRIETGAIHDGSIEVVSGVDPGERIVNKGAGFLKDGDLVSVSTAVSGS